MMRFIQIFKKALTFIIHFSELVRGCCPSCASLRLCRQASSPADSHNWSAAPRGATFTKTRVQTPSAVTDESLSLSSFYNLFSPSLCFPTPGKNSPGLASFFFSFFFLSLALLLVALHTSSSPLFLSLSREIFLLLLLFPLPATSSISPPTLSPSPPPPPVLTLTLCFQCVTALKI